MTPSNMRLLNVTAIVVTVVAGGPRAAAKDYPGLADCELLAKLKPLWKRALKELNVPGAALVVVQNDEIIALETYGRRNVATGAPVTPDTMFYVASCTKPFTAAGVAALAEEEQLALDAPVRHYLSRFALADEQAATTITVNDLLCHRPALTDGAIVYHDAYTGQITDDLYYARLAHVRPGDAPRYTNVHFTLLGRVIRAVTGQSLKDHLAKRIFAPAGMSRTTAYASRMYSDDDCAVPAVISAGRWVTSPVVKTDRTMHAAGGMGTTALDLSRWLRLNLNRGRIDGRQVLAPETIEAMHKYQSRTEPSGQIRCMDGFGLGWQRGTYRGETPLLSHGGGYIGTAAYMCLLPEQNAGLAILANGAPHGQGLSDVMAVAICDILIDREPQDLLAAYVQRIERLCEHLKSQQPTGGNPAEGDALTLAPTAYVGTFVDPNGRGGQLQVRLEDGKLVAAAGDLPYHLYSTGPDAVAAVIVPGMQREATFRIEDGRVVALEMEVDDELVIFRKQ